MSGEESNSHTRLEIGRTLERARRERALSLERIEAATKIRARYLRALENENFDVLPAVYVLGSLKTYARYLGLDAEALTRELKHRQALLQEEQEEAQEEPQAAEPGGFLASLSRLFGVGNIGTDEDDAGTVPDPGHSPRLYLSLGVVLIFVLVTAIASSLRAEDQPVISQVSEPKTSQVPSMLAFVGTPEGGASHTENRESRPENEAKPSAKDSSKGEKDKADRSEKDASITAQASSSSATASASVSAKTASASASAKIASASTGPEPEAREEPVRAGGDAAADASSGPSTRAPRRPALRHKQAGPDDAATLGDRIRSKVRNAVNSTR